MNTTNNQQPSDKPQEQASLAPATCYAALQREVEWLAVPLWIIAASLNTGTVQLMLDITAAIVAICLLLRGLMDWRVKRHNNDIMQPSKSL